jgi:hypothetical protein
MLRTPSFSSDFAVESCCPAGIPEGWSSTELAGEENQSVFVVRGRTNMA